MLAHKYMDQNGWATMLATTTERSAGVTPEVNISILLHAGDEAYIHVGKGIHTGFET